MWKELSELQRTEVVCNAKTILRAGQWEIFYYLKREIGIEIPYGPHWMDVGWTTEKVGGSFAKRIARWIYKKHGIKIDNDHKAQIGELAERHSRDERGYFTVSVRDKMDWRQGKFGDDGSCFWGGRQSDRVFMSEHEDFIFLTVEHGHDGVGRCICVKSPNESVIMFNYYGLGPTDFLAIIESLYPEAKIAPVSLTLGDIFVNGAQPYAMSFEEIEYNSHKKIYVRPYCSKCGLRLSTQHELMHEGEYICDPCYQSMFWNCDLCGERTLKDDLVIVRYNPRKVACPSCVAEYGAKQCYMCGGILSESSVCVYCTEPIGELNV